jgi:uncharacterized protein (TIGR02679 family)
MPAQPPRPAPELGELRGDLADPDLLPLWQAIADRLAQGQNPARIVRVRVRGLSAPGRAIVAGWLASDPITTGRPARLHTDPAGTTAIPLPQVLRRLGLAPDQLPALVARAVGPIPDRAGQRRQAAQLRGDLWAHASRLLADTPRLLVRLRAAGVREHQAGELRTLIDALGRARARLPLPRPVPLARFALACAGRPHYFDLGDPGHGDKLVLLAADLLQVSLPDTPAAERAVLARVGVLADRLSQTVLTLNIDAAGDGPTDRALRLARADRRPIHLTLHDLTAYPPTLRADESWLVVENSSVVDEALLRGVAFPVVCTAGALTAVDHVLLGLAQAARIPMRYAGDLDPGGVAVAETVRSRYGGQPCHMDAATLRAAARAGPLSVGPEGAPILDGPSQTSLTAPLAAAWDPQLAAAARNVGRVVFQEHALLLDRLLGADGDDPLSPTPRYEQKG